MSKIYKKTWPQLFQAVLDGKKSFDMRVADFDCKEGDELIMQEWDPETKSYTGREISKRVKFVLKTKDQIFWKPEDIDKYGFQVISF